MFFEDSDRERLGGLNLGSVREVGGHRVQVVGFTEGLEPFGPPLSFASYTLARELTHLDNHLENYVLVGVQPGASPERVAQELQASIPNVNAITKQQLVANSVRYLLLRTALGVTFGASCLIGLLVGFVIVALTMFSAVLDHLREFGTLKALGATNRDLAKLLATQAVFCALLGSLVGESAVSLIIRKVSSPKLVMFLPPQLMAATFAVMVVLCILASGLAMWRLRSLEPAMVFRG
jgi:putative ABC transport system permease protein